MSHDLLAVESCIKGMDAWVYLAFIAATPEFSALVGILKTICCGMKKVNSALFCTALRRVALLFR